MNHPFHPLANEYPLMTSAELDVLAVAFRERGYWPELGKIVTLDGLILDGRNRYLACRKAGVNILDHQVEYTGDTSEESLRRFVESANDHRRHESPEARQERVDRVAQQRRDGASLRMIADSEGVSESQIRRDLETAQTTAPGGAVEPESGKVTGKDGKERPARRKPKDPVPPKESPVDPDGPEPDFVTEVLDDGGEPIPQQCRAVFLQRDRIAAFIAAIDELRREIKDFAGTVAGAYMFLNSVETNLTQARFAVSKARPARVCPKCKAEKADCRTCKGHGWVNEDIYKTFVSQGKS